MLGVEVSGRSWGNSAMDPCFLPAGAFRPVIVFKKEGCTWAKQEACHTRKYKLRWNEIVVAFFKPTPQQILPGEINGTYFLLFLRGLHDWWLILRFVGWFLHRKVTMTFCTLIVGFYYQAFCWWFYAISWGNLNKQSRAMSETLFAFCDGSLGFLCVLYVSLLWFLYADSFAWQRTCHFFEARC